MISERRKHGRFYTPAFLADLALSVTLGDRWPPARLLDPSCGDGALLAAAVRRGLPESAIVGGDTDPLALEVARAAMPVADLAVADLFESRHPAALYPAIIGNPPYVRSDRLSAPAKERIAASLSRAHPSADLRRLLGRADLAACALLRAAAMLEPGGRLGFIVSAAILEADYAEPLWAALAAIGSVVEIVAAPEERWFPEAAVNTIILVFEAGRAGPTRLSRLRHSTRDCASRVARPDDLEAVADVRIDHAGSPRRWAHLLRAPALWLELESSSALVPLGEVARIRRGITSGANEIFYLSRDRARAEAIEPESLAPVVRAPPRSGDVTIEVDPGATSSLLLRVPKDLGRLPGAAAYLERHAEAATRSTLKARHQWWRLPSRPARIFLAKAYGRRFVQRYSPIPLDCDQRVYAVEPRDSIAVPLLAAILNGSLTAMAIEALGRASMGQGAIEWTVADARSLPIIDPRKISRADQARIVRRFHRMASRPIGAAELEAREPDRRALDDALLAIDPLLAASARHLAAGVATAALAREARAQRS